MTLLTNANAQESEEPGLQEVVVTAERQSAPLARTPLSVGVVGAGDIERRGVTQLSDLAGLVAGVLVPNGFSNQPQAVVIRGVGGSSPALSQAVGIYLDDVPLVRGYATALWDLPDIQRIEVLRGPQGTLYGQNSTAGAVRLISIRPSADPVAWASVGVGNLSSLETRAYVNGPLGGAASPLAGSLAVSHSQNDGFGYNATLGVRVNRLDATQARGQLTWALSSSTDVLLAIDGLLDTSDTDSTNYPINLPNSRPRVTYTSLADPSFRRKAGGIALTVESRQQASTFRSITSVRTYDDDPVRGDFAGLPVERWLIDQSVTQKTWSQELQWLGRKGSWSWTTGALAVYSRFDFDRYTLTYPLAASAPSENVASSRFNTVDLGVYGQARWAFDERSGATLGLRGYRTRQTGSNEYWNSNVSEERTSVIYDAEGLSKTNSGVVPRLGIDRQFDDDLFGYASIAEGEKFSGFNRAAQSLTSASFAPDPEKVITYEAGIKAAGMRKRVEINASAFLNDYRNYLASLNNATIDGTLVTDQVLLNAGRARTYGVDIEINALVANATTVRTSLELLRSRFLSFLNPAGKTDYVGNQLPNAPKFTFGASVEQKLRLSDTLAASAEAAVRIVGRNFTEVTNDPTLAAPTATYVDVNASVASLTNRWTISGRVRNLFDRTYGLLRTRVPAFGMDTMFYNPQRTFVVTARYDFL